MREDGISQLCEVESEGDYASLIFERRFLHAQETVWKAITEPEQLAKWYMTKAKIDGKVGGIIDFISGPSHFHITGKISIWDPPNIFEHEWNVAPLPLRPKGESAIIRWELHLEGEETVLRLIHRHLTRQTSFGFAPGTHDFLDQLALYLDNNPILDWRMRVEELRGCYPRFESKV